MSSSQRFWIWATVALLLGAVLYILKGILLPFVAGMLVAYILNPVTGRLESWRIPRTLATILIILIFFSAIAAIFFFAFPYIQAEVINLAIRIPGYGVTLHKSLMDYFDGFSGQLSPTDWETIKLEASKYMGDIFSWFGKFLADLLTGGLALANLIALVIITPIVSFYLLRDWNRLVKKVQSWFPVAHQKVISTLFEDMDRALGGFARGQALVCLTLATFYGFGLWFLGLDSGAVIGVLTGIFAFVPYLGVLTGFIISLLMSFAQFGDWAPILMVMGLFGVGQVLEGNFLTPNLVGERVGLHPVWIIFAILSGATIGGLLGVLIAMPIAAIIGVLVRFGMSQYMASPLYKHLARKAPAAKKKTS
ncbi:MAG: AI-2E family transporter [Alphaproteobacteria bacterium]|nr:AI-2E family transporter [Alphaproteobacteria bacterium]MBT5389896.1 AI-2E family transporter [Alphaproteobacteria bacterium]MBT5540384.1 AI-2E family transporter [Alphaproteobacteria bacterium]MBT5654165.1 AI-2E family transporter [Alphaproteobacteria bacterium]